MRRREEEAAAAAAASRTQERERERERESYKRGCKLRGKSNYGPTSSSTTHTFRMRRSCSDGDSSAETGRERGRGRAGLEKGFSLGLSTKLRESARAVALRFSSTRLVAAASASIFPLR